MKLKRVVLIVFAIACSAWAQTNGFVTVPLPADLSGTLHGTEYKIRVPANWNGTLLVYVHGRQAGSLRTEIVPATWPAVTPSLEDQLLAQGYAIAGTGYPNTLRSSIQDTLAVTLFFQGRIGNPRRTIVWGISLGGLATLKLIENYPGIYDGAIASSALAAGYPKTMDWALAFGLAYRAAYGWRDDLWGPIEDLRDGLDFFTEVGPFVQWPGSEPDWWGKWEFMRRLVQLPPEAFWATDPEAASPFFGMNMWKATGARAAVEQEAGGPVAQNVGCVYAVTSQDKQELAAFGVDADALLADMNAHTNIEATPQAREYIKIWGEPTGRIHRPVLTMHAIFDGLAPVANERVYATKAAKAGSSGRLVQVFVNAAGHSAFTVDQHLATLTALNSWLDTGIRPDASAFAASVGFVSDYVPPVWPFDCTEKTRGADEQ